MYLVLQYVTAQRQNFAVIFFLNFQAMDKILLLKERLEMTLSICPGILTKIMLECGEQQSPYSDWRYKEHPKV